MTRAPALAVLLLVIVSMACGGRPDRPPEIRVGVDVCDQCRMIINELRFAAGYRTVDGIERRFDDIGCMVTYLDRHRETPAQVWVHDLEQAAWLDATAAWYVRSARVATPMGYGVVAFGERERARAFADPHRAPVLSYAELLQQAATLRPQPGAGP